MKGEIEEVTEIPLDGIFKDGENAPMVAWNEEEGRYSSYEPKDMDSSGMHILTEEGLPDEEIVEM